MANPIQIPKVTKDDPPKLIRGSGRPTIGIIPMTMDIFINVCQKKIDIIPMARIES